MSDSVWIKVCGITSVEDARLVADAGASAIGLNFAAVSPRVISPELGREIVRAVGARVEWVGVFVNQSPDEVRRIQELVGLDWVQLHGSETPEQLAECGERAWKALRIRDAADVAEAERYGGARILVDAKSDLGWGGTGHTFDWRLIETLNAERRLILAGGLTPDNVASAVAQVQPWGVDTASGVEETPRKKNPQLVREFVRAARQVTRPQEV